LPQVIYNLIKFVNSVIHTFNSFEPSFNPNKNLHKSSFWRRFIIRHGQEKPILWYYGRIWQSKLDETDFKVASKNILIKGS